MRARLVLAALLAGLLASSAAAAGADQPSTWLCRPGLTSDPCAFSLAATAVDAAGRPSPVKASAAPTGAFDCFYVYPTVSPETSANADLRIQSAEIAVAQAQASRFAQVCQVYAPIYRQVTLAGLLTGAGTQAGPLATAYNSIAAGFEDFLAHYSDGRRFVLIGHSQGAAMSILLIQRLIDQVPALRARLLLAIILGGNVEVPAGKIVGGSFKDVPGCSRLGETGCVIAYSSFPSTPPADALFARPGQGVSLQSDQTATQGLEVLCTNPAALAGGSATLDPYFPSLGREPTPWVTFPGLYDGRCEQAAGASWLDVTKATGRSDHRPTVTEHDGPLWGYHADDVNLALGNLVSDIAAAEATATRAR